MQRDRNTFEEYTISTDLATHRDTDPFIDPYSEHDTFFSDHAAFELHDIVGSVPYASTAFTGHDPGAIVDNPSNERDDRDVIAVEGPRHDPPVENGVLASDVDYAYSFIPSTSSEDWDDDHHYGPYVGPTQVNLAGSPPLRASSFRFRNRPYFELRPRSHSDNTASRPVFSTSSYPLEGSALADDVFPEVGPSPMDYQHPPLFGGAPMHNYPSPALQIYVPTIVPPTDLLSPHSAINHRRYRGLDSSSIRSSASPSPGLDWEHSSAASDLDDSGASSYGDFYGGSYPTELTAELERPVNSLAGDLEQVHLAQQPEVYEGTRRADENLAINLPFHSADVQTQSRHATRQPRDTSSSAILGDVGHGGLDSSSAWDHPGRLANQSTGLHKSAVSTEAGRTAATARRKNPTIPGAFVCDLCGDDFTAKHNLKNHKDSHMGRKTHSCPMCDKCFGTSGVQKRHQRKCGNVGPYPKARRGARPERGRGSGSLSSAQTGNASF
ncbi:hypothetical protein B0H15DRAFT_447094 [Mycena belliarum]|uniref:C2H2-type domain-containing protein n=1 Tax=Mycena belliarum TaxID=1033014 RepID=A0AAD6XMP0_9AGAR|nr:hypothetical protein B0H15DRAFT_447094 [Mycena belliae]